MVSTSASMAPTQSICSVRKGRSPSKSPESRTAQSVLPRVGPRKRCRSTPTRSRFPCVDPRRRWRPDRPRCQRRPPRPGVRTWPPNRPAALRAAEKAGVIEPERVARQHHPTRYRLNLDELKRRRRSRRRRRTATPRQRRQTDAPGRTSSQRRPSGAWRHPGGATRSTRRYRRPGRQAGHRLGQRREGLGRRLPAPDRAGHPPRAHLRGHRVGASGHLPLCASPSPRVRTRSEPGEAWSSTPCPRRPSCARL